MIVARRAICRVVQGPEIRNNGTFAQQQHRVKVICWHKCICARYRRHRLDIRLARDRLATHFAALISAAFDWLVTVDPHLHRRSSLAEIYSIPAATVAAAPALAKWIAENISNPLIVGPDAESEQWAAEVAAACGAPHAIMHKTRLGDRQVEIQAPPLSQWKDRTPVLIDDIISSARTMALAAKKIREAGLDAPVCVGVHGVFSPDALGALRDAGAARIVTTNTIAHETNAIDVSALVARGIESVRKS